LADSEFGLFGHTEVFQKCANDAVEHQKDTPPKEDPEAACYSIATGNHQDYRTLRYTEAAGIITDGLYYRDEVVRGDTFLPPYFNKSRHFGLHQYAKTER
ncbi:MAG: hypothetical protein J5I59_03720, partial [Saprospiraceae bacterium]|nr:hypothetical protein [Saprospiraceae bacterium]